MTMDAKILVVDDEPEVLFATSRTLKKAGYMVLEAETGQKALELAREHLPDLILLDVVLPDMDGVEVCRSLKTSEMTSDIHVVLITGKRLATDDKVFGLEEGADDYIVRPIRNHELLARVKAQLRLVSAEKELKEHRRLLEHLLERRSAELKSEKAEHQLTACSLVESEKQCQDIVKNLPGTAYQFVLNTEGDSYFQYMGDNCLSLFGYRPEEILSNPNLVFDRIPRPDRDTVARAMEVSAATMTPYNVVHRYLKKTGERVWIHSSSIPSLRPDGGIVWNGIGLDITERKRFEEALQESEAFLKKLIDAIPMPIFYKDGNGKYLGFNQAFETFFGETKEHMIGKSVFDINPPELAEVYSAQDDELLSSGGVQRYESQWKNAHGRLCDFIFNKAAFTDSEGNVAGLIGVIQDITEKKAREEENIKLIGLLQHAQKLESIGNLAGGIAHDFNNILFPIMGLSELLVEDLSPGSLEHENARRIQKAAERGSDLVQQILAFSRQTDHKMMPIKIQNVLREALKLARSTIPANIEIERHIQSDCGLVNGDATQVHQIAMNLITNAFHAVEHTDGKINVQLKEVNLESEDIVDLLIEPGSYAMLTVSDTGCGIEPLNIKRIFEPYFTTKEQGKGTGLGLAVVYGIIKEHRGDIKVESELNEGTTFTVYLPLIEKPNDTESIERNVNYETGNEHILLVDDEKPILHVEKQMLERLGYHVTFRTNGLDALETFAANPNSYDMVISDMSMPNITGDKLAQKLISIRPDIPIIICTGFSERIEKGKADAIGIKGLLLKPIAKLEMAKMVRKVLDEARSTAQE
ncbi:MAG: response regulator [Deltaproteobacteria bacterium]|nr:response regulator [Deltaproteobacteria bacterium]